MRTRNVPLEHLTTDTVSEYDYYSSRGELLISRGVRITERHIRALQRRHITTLLINEKPSDINEQEELTRLLEKTLPDVKNTWLDEMPDSFPPYKEEKQPRLIRSKEYIDIKPGLEGLNQLLQSERVSGFDSKIDRKIAVDLPSGRSLKSQLHDTLLQRDEQYKRHIMQAYFQALKDIRLLLNALADGKNIYIISIQRIIERFVNIFFNDQYILMGLSFIKPPGDIEYLYHHSINTALLSIIIAAAIGYSRNQIIEIGTGALLHDVGMFLIPHAIRYKMGHLGKYDYFEIQKHPIFGINILEKQQGIPESALYISYQTHERENSMGYPKKRSARFIHNFAKIVQVADIFEALTSPRIYRPAYVPYKAIELIIKMSHQGLIDGTYVKALLEYSSLFPVGSIVELSDNRIARVVKPNGVSFAKPVLRVLTDKEKILLPEKKTYFINLQTDTAIQITQTHALDFLGDISILHGF
jgi:HD-GYP domain-containing protein (c-di-GMP phosphodiesterase class II)